MDEAVVVILWKPVWRLDVTAKSREIASRSNVMEDAQAMDEAM